MKRYISLLLLLAFVPMLLAVPAHADEVEDPFIELLDYGYATETGTNTVRLQNGVGDATYVLPQGTAVAYVDILFTYYESYDANSVEVFHNDGYSLGVLTVEKVSENLYRAYGNLDQVLYAFRLKLHFNCEVTGWLSILSFRISPLKSSPAPLYGKCQIDNGSYTATINYRPEDEANERYWTNDLNYDLNLYVTAEDWTKYDFIEFTFQISNTIQISSITAIQDRLSLPCEVSYISNGASDYQFTIVTVRMDLRGVDRESGYTPILYIYGEPASGTGHVEVWGINGFVVIDGPSPFTFWFTRLSFWIQNQTSALTSSISSLGTTISNWFADQTSSITNAITSAADRIIDALAPENNSNDLNNKLQDSLGHLGEAGTALDSVSRPDIGQVDFNVISKVPVSGMNAMASIVDIVYTNDALGPLMLMYLTLAVAAFVIFGRS